MIQENNNYKSKLIKFIILLLDYLIDCANIIIYMMKSLIYGVRQPLWLIRYHQEELGGYHSYLERKPQDNNKNPIPWYTYSAIEFLRQLDFSNSHVFEYGSGGKR